MSEIEGTQLPAPGSYDVLLIDGRSGSGKTQLADRALAAARAAGFVPQLLHVEDLYPGWDGLAAGARALPAVLTQRHYRRYDWGAGAFAEQIELGSEIPLIVEGCGALTRASQAAAAEFAGPDARVISVWLECPEPIRRARALARDGETYAPHWQRWARQEDALYARTQPWCLVTSIIARDG